MVATGAWASMPERAKDKTRLTGPLTNRFFLAERNLFVQRARSGVVGNRLHLSTNRFGVFAMSLRLRFGAGPDGGSVGSGRILRSRQVAIKTLDQLRDEKQAHAGAFLMGLDLEELVQALGQPNGDDSSRLLVLGHPRALQQQLCPPLTVFCAMRG